MGVLVVILVLLVAVVLMSAVRSCSGCCEDTRHCCVSCKIKMVGDWWSKFDEQSNNENKLKTNKNDFFFKIVADGVGVAGA